MTELGVQTLIHYPVTIQRQKAFKGQQSDAFPASNSFADQIVSIPIYPELIDAQVDKICSAVNAVLSQDID
jgi:dTDP-4-amino-4,6-dideoxygalactose transaminase